MTGHDIRVRVTVTIENGTDITTREAVRNFGANIFATIPSSLEEVAQVAASHAAELAVAGAKATVR